MIGSPERVRIQRSSLSKIRKIHSCVWKLQVKHSKNSQFWPKNGQIFVLNGQNFTKSELSRHIKYDFLKEDHKGSFHKKNYENLQRRLEDIGQKHSRMAILAKKWSNFGLFIFHDTNIFRNIEHDFLKKDCKSNFHTKNQEDSQRRLEVKGQKPSKLSILAKKQPNFGHKWPNFAHLRIFPAYRV